MSEAELRDPTAPSRDPASTPVEASDDSVPPPDPLLGSGSFIDPDRSDSGAQSLERLEQTRNGKVDPLTVIAATPISVVAPDKDTPEPTQKVRATRNPEEMAKRPSWLPEDWKMDLRVRTSGASKGLIDRYYIEPSGQRKFRSKNEVLHFLETGSKLKRKSEGDSEASGSSATPKPKKSSTRSTKSEAGKEA